MKRRTMYAMTLWISIFVASGGIARADWTKLAGTPSTFWYVGLTADAHGGVFLYESTGGGGDGFWRYDIVGDNWQQLANTPITGRGAYLEADTSSGLVYWQSGATRFFVYDPNTGMWDELAPTPVSAWSDGYVMTNSDMCVNPHSRKVYWHSGNRAFFEYDISLDTWTRKDSTPVSGNGDMVVHPVSNKIYWHQGFDPNSGHQNGFYEYDITGDSWQSLAFTPVTNANGGLAILPAEDRVYWSRGGLTADFLRYDILTGIWSSAGTTPTTGQFGNLAADWSGNFIYYYGGFSVNPDSIFWKYTSTSGRREQQEGANATGRGISVPTFFNHEITLKCSSAFSGGGSITCTLYDVSGKTLFRGIHPAPVPSIVIGGPVIDELPSGMYLLIVRADGHFETFKMVKVK